MWLIFLSVTVNEKPDFRDLSKHVIEQYAIHWEEIAKLLQLPLYVIDNIRANFRNKPDKVQGCFTETLIQWGQRISSPTWGKLDDAIHIVVSIHSGVIPSEGNTQYILMYPSIADYHPCVQQYCVSIVTIATLSYYNCPLLVARYVVFNLL